MLEELEITNLGIISQADIVWSPGLNVLTGETGAGKTMVLNSVQLLTGARGSSTFVQSGASNCEVVATFGVDPQWIAAHSQELDDRGAQVDERTTKVQGLIISRELSAQGRSKAYLGGKHVPIVALSEISDSLITVHGQTEQIRLRDPREQLALVDRAGGEARQVTLGNYHSARKRWRTLVKQRSALVANRGENDLKAQVLAASLSEIQEIAPNIGEDLELQSSLQVSRSAEAIRSIIQTVREILTESDSGQAAVSTQIGTAVKEIHQAVALDPGLTEFIPRLESVLSDVIDIEAELSDHLRALNADPAHLEFMEQRLALIKALLKKYGPTVEDIHEWVSRAEAQLPLLQFTDESLEQLENDIALALSDMTTAAQALTAERKKTAADLSTKIQAELSQLAMPHAVVHIEVTPDVDPVKWTRTGADSVNFMIAAHGGSDFRPMGSSVSGGELSRLMLAVEVVLAAKNPVPTMVFDEVDAGIGGEVAVEVGRRLAQLAAHTQVIVVTHLPQVAAFAQSHFVVTKTTDTQGATTTVTEVTGEERTREITRMLSGLPDSTSGAAHAEELLALARG